MRSEDMSHAKKVIKTLNCVIETIRELQNSLRGEFNENVFNTNRSMNYIEQAIKQLEELD